MSDEKIDVLAVMNDAARTMAIHDPSADDAAFEEMRAARDVVAELIRAARAASNAIGLGFSSEMLREARGLLDAALYRVRSS